jgi:hypothetical protein
MATTLLMAVAGLVGVWAGDVPVLATPPAPAPPPPPAFQARAPEIQLALRTPPDLYGVPSGLYQLDTQLIAYRDGVEAAARARRASGRTVMILGGVGLGIAALLFWRASTNADAADAARARGDIVINDPSDMQYALGAVEGVIALGCVGYGAALTSTRPDPAPLVQYSRETYGVPR